MIITFFLEEYNRTHIPFFLEFPGCRPKGLFTEFRDLFQISNYFLSLIFIAPSSTDTGFDLILKLGLKLRKIEQRRLFVDNNGRNSKGLGW